MPPPDTNETRLQQAQSLTTEAATPLSKRPISSHEQTVTIETHNPYFQRGCPEGPQNPRTILATLNARNHPIALLYAKGHIRLSQYKAAERFYVYWYHSHGNLPTSRDYTRQKIDGTPLYTHSIERQIDASNHLRLIKTQLGILGYNLVERVVCYGYPLKHLSPSKRKQNSLADHLRDCLDLLANHWGYTNHTSSS